MKSTLNPKQRRFVAEYLKDQNATQAAIRAGYSKKTARQQASDLLTKPDIRAAVDAKLEKVEEDCGVTVEYVLTNLKEVVERCMQRQAVMVRDGRDMVQLVDDKGRDVWQFDSPGVNRALELLGKYRKMFSDKVEHSLSESLEQILAKSR